MPVRTTMPAAVAAQNCAHSCELCALAVPMTLAATAPVFVSSSELSDATDRYFSKINLKFDQPIKMPENILDLDKRIYISS